MKLIEKILLTLIVLMFGVFAVDSREVYQEALFQCMDMVDFQKEAAQHTWTKCKEPIVYKGAKGLGHGESMMPFISENHKMTYCVPDSVNDIFIGDIVLACSKWDEKEYRCVVHTVINITKVDGEKRFITRGYNTEAEDMPLWKYGEIKAKLWKVEAI